MRPIIVLIFSVLLFQGCQEDDPYVPTLTTYISGETFTDGVVINGHGYDELIIENCSFTGKGLEIDNVDKVVVRNCLFAGINENAIEIGFKGPATNLIIEDCTFKKIAANGIYGFEDCGGAQILDNHFEDIGLSEIGGAMGEPHHAIYWMSPDVLVEGNEIFNVVNNDGSGVSLRSSGHISKNEIHDCAGAGVAYLSDHPGFLDTVLIENNFIYDCNRSVVLTSNGETANHAGLFWVRFNTLVDRTQAPFVANSGFNATSGIWVYGNILINQEDATYMTTGSLVVGDSNLVSMDDIGFVDFIGRDLHIISGSQAINFAAGLTEYPVDDIDGDPRAQWILDAGADEY